MAWVQKTTPPPNRILSFSLKDFSGGMNNRSDQIKDNEGAVVLNLMFADDTILETRYGQKFYNSDLLDGSIIFIDEYKPYNNPNQFIRATKDKMHIDDKVTPLKGKPSGVNHFGNYYFSDGEKIKVFGRFDIPVSTYVYHIGTPIEGNEVYEIVSPAPDHVKLGKEHRQGVLNIDFTNKKIWYEPCLNEFEDEYKGACVVPESVKYVLSHGGRLFVSGHKQDDDNVFITDIHNPFYFAVGLPIQLPPNSDMIKGMHIFDNSVIIGREYDIYAIHGSTNRLDIEGELFKLRRLNTHTGFASHSAINIAHNYLIFLGSDGNVYGMTGAFKNEKELSTVIISKTIDLTKYPIEAKREDYSSASSFFFNDEWYLSVGDKVMVYSYRHMSWVMYDGIDAKCFYGIDGEWIWGMGNGMIGMFDKENFFDFGEPYQSLWYSKMFDMDDANSFKQFREFFLVAHTFSLQYSDIYVTFEIDYANVRDRAVISNQVARWGFAKFGDRFVSKNINESLPFVIGRRGRNIRIKVINGYPLDGMVESYEDLEYYPEKRDNLLVKVGKDQYYLYFQREWILLEDEALNQRMKLYQINGDYEMRGKR